MRFAEDYDVIIAGARPAGAATALLLARAGARVLVVVGQRFQCHRASNFIDGVGRDAEDLARHLAGLLGARLAA